MTKLFLGKKVMLFRGLCLMFIVGWVLVFRSLFIRRGFSFEAKKRLNVFYRGKCLEQFFVADFICFDEILIEIKAVNCLLGVHRAQILNYLKVAGCRLGFLVNFGDFPRVGVERFVL